MAYFDGRAVLPLALPLVDRFTKQFAIDADALELRGRVDVRKGWLGNTLYPLYFSVLPKPITVAGMLNRATRPLHCFMAPKHCIVSCSTCIHV